MTLGELKKLAAKLDLSDDTEIIIQADRYTWYRDLEWEVEKIGRAKTPVLVLRG